jgi:hypothetical protein
MKVQFAIEEWLECPSCFFLCDAPFTPDGAAIGVPQLVLGLSLPESMAVPTGEWRVDVSAPCPKCGKLLEAVGVFDGRQLRSFGWHGAV